MNPFSRIISRYLVYIWVLNCALASVIAMKQVWVPYMNAVNENNPKIVSEPFDGTVSPIAYIPDWTRPANQDKSKRFEDISISEFVPLPFYDPIALLDEKNTSKNTTLLRYTYFTQYMGNYKLDYHEHAGGHLGIDIRAPIGTPVQSIANGVVTRITEGDATGDKYIVVRHDGVPGENGKTTSLYSGYLHLSEILVKEGDRVKKGDMIGRVGLTGITTTPHLHLQIDTADAPFHPYWHFTTAESKSAGLGFYDAINAGLNKEKAERYTINPMQFINTYLGGTNIIQNPDIKIATNTLPTKTNISSTAPTPQSKVIASYISTEDECIGKRFPDIDKKSNFGQILYPLVDKKCLFRENSSFAVKDIITYREALINTMRYFDVSPSTGTSHFLDIALGDDFQGYALTAYRKGILEGNYAFPDHIMTREEVAALIKNVAQAEKNPSQIKIYADVDPMNPLYASIQDYGFLVRARGGKFFPKTLVTRGMFVQMLASVKR